MMTRSERWANKVAYNLVFAKVSIPTWIVLYINILISILTINFVYVLGSSAFDNSLPFNGRVWPVVLLAASLSTLHGLLAGYHRTVSIGSFLGFMSWVMAFISWWVTAGAYGSPAIPLLAVPMIIFFMFVHLKHSYIDRLEKERLNGEDE